MKQEHLGKNYPNLINAQMTCLHCQTAMWISAIAYAIAHNISMIVSGYRKSDTFCTGHLEYIERISALAEQFHVKIELPVWNTPTWDEPYDWARNNEFAIRCFVPKVLEPKCLLGRATEPMSDSEKHDMMQYFNDHIDSLLENQINHLIPIFRTVKLSEKSIAVLHYPTPDGREGYL